MKPRIHFGVFIIICIVLSACQRSSPTQIPTETVILPITNTFTSVSTLELPTQTATETAIATSTNTNTFTPSPEPPTAEATASNTPTPTHTATATVIPVTELLFTGAIVPGRCVQAAIDERGNADYIYENLSSMIQGADLAVGTLNAALSDYSTPTGCVQTFVLVGGSENADAMARAGFDIMSVATNHIKNCNVKECGDRAFFDTLANLERVDIQAVGAGANLKEALQPIVATVNGIRFGFVSLGEIEARAFASKTEPGIAVLTSDNLRLAIDDARQVADVVIVMPHWGSDYSSIPNFIQLAHAQEAVDAGADLVIGNHAHVIQGMEFIDEVPVFYGLGSFVFDQDWSLETQQGIIVRIFFEGTEYSDFQVIPVHIDGDGYVYIPETDEVSSILGRFDEISRRIP